MKKWVVLTVLCAGFLSAWPVHAERLVNYYNEQEPESLDPALATGKLESRIIINLFDGLVEYDPKTNDAIPALAEKWSLSPDGKTYTFTIRKNAKWSNGSPITADDFVYSWERALNPKTASEYAGLMHFIVGAENYNTGKSKDATALGFKAKDPQTLVVTLNAPTPFFVQTLAMPVYRPVPKAVVEKFGNKWTLPENIITSGAFVLSSWEPQKEIVTRKNPQYWDAVGIDGIRFLPIGDHETAFKMYQTGQVDLIFQLPPNRIRELIEKPIPGFIQGPYLTSYFYWVNTEKLSNPKVRCALAAALDRTTIANQYLHQTFAPLGTLTGEGIAGYSYPTPVTFDAVKARTLLKEAGVSDPAGLPPIEIHYNSDETHRLVAQVIQQMLKTNLGINTTLHNEEWKVYLKTQQAGNYQISRGGWVADYADPSTFLDLFRSTDPNNKSRWKNANFDRLMRQAHEETSPQKRLALLSQAESLLLSQCPALPIMQWKNFNIIRPGLDGVYSTVLDMHAMKFVRWGERAPWEHVRARLKK